MQENGVDNLRRFGDPFEGNSFTHGLKRSLSRAGAFHE